MNELARTFASFSVGLVWLGGALGCAGNPSPLPTEPGATLGSGGFDIFHDRSLEQTCARLARTDELLCRLDRRLIEARNAGDSNAVTCYAQRGREMRAAFRLVGASRERLSSNDSLEGDHTLERQRIQASERALEQGFAQLDSCEARTGVVERAVTFSGPYDDGSEVFDTSSRAAAR